MNEQTTHLKVIIVNDDPAQLRTLSALIEKAGYTPVPCDSAERALERMISEPPPALIITDVVMPGIDGWRFCRLLKSEEYAAFNHVPIMVVSAVFSGEQPEQIAADLGAKDFLAAPVAGPQFIERVQAVIRGEGSVKTVRQRVLIVDDESKTLEFLRAFFETEGYDVLTAPTLTAGRQQVATANLDIAILDFRLPDGSGDALLEPILKKNPDCACIMITGDLDPKRSLDWMKMGAAAYVSKPFDPAYLLAMCSRVRRERLLLQMPKILERRTDDLLASERRLTQVINSVPSVAVRGYQVDGTILYWNQAAENLYGYSSAEAIGQNLFDLILPRTIHDRVHEDIQTILRTGQVPPHAEVELIRKDGALVSILSSYTMIKASEECVEFFSFDIDLTERKRAEAELQQIQKMDSIGRLAGGVAHDFNNMLGVILGHTEMALDGLSSDHPLHPNLKEIHKAARHSSDLTRQLLAFARKQSSTPRALDLNHSVDGTLGMLRRLIGEHVELQWKAHSEATPIFADPVHIDQILTNLCVNSRDAIGPSGGTIEISTGTCKRDKESSPGHPAGEFVFLRIRDTGCGMEAETLKHLYEPFYTTKKNGEGTGLGLATVYGVVRQNAGFIDVKSAPETGTTFTIFFPRHTGAEIGQPSSPSNLSNQDAAALTILLVEDEPAMLRIVRNLLQRSGYTVLPAASAMEAIELAAAHEGHIDLLLTDVVMPGMNGRELADQLQTQYPSLRCLFMSGYSTDVIARHGVINDKVHFIQKPFNVKSLSEAVQQALSEFHPD